MLKITSRLLAVVLLCGIVQAGVFVKADDFVKTGEKRDTLLYVRTDPPGAKVLLDDKELGISSGLFQVEPGTVTITVKLDGHEQREMQVTIRANSITRVVLELKPQAKAKAAAATEAEVSHFFTFLSQGTVELVGITDYPPTKQSQWWKPDGSAVRLDQSVLLPQPTQWLTPAEKTVTFLLRFQNLSADASRPVCDVEPCTNRWWGSTGVLDVHGTTVPNYSMFHAELGASAVTASLRVGVSTGAWDTVITQKPDRDGTSSFSRDGQQWALAFQKATAGAFSDSTEVAFTPNGDFHGKWNTRLIAVDNDGNEHTPSAYGFKQRNGHAGFRDLPLSLIKEFRFQVRPYERVEFKNVAIQSGQKTDVRITSLGSEQATSPQHKIEKSEADRERPATVVGVGQYYARDAKLNEAQRRYRDWTEKTFHALLDPSPWNHLNPQEKAAEEEKMLDQLDSEEQNERISAINALAALGSRKAVPALLEIAAEQREKDNRDRWMAIRALGIIGDPIAVPELVHLTYHYNMNTRFWARISLVRLTGEDFGRDVAAWKQWWEKQGGKPPISDQPVAWATSPETLKWSDPQKMDEVDRQFVKKPARTKGAGSHGATSADMDFASQLREAKAGNFWAKYRVWAAYQKGIAGVQKDPEEAKKWLAQLIDGAYIATFRPVKGFAPKTPQEFLAKFNEHSTLQSEATGLGGASFFRTTAVGNTLIGAFLTAYPDQMRKAIAANPSLELIAIEKLTPETFLRYEASRQESLE